MDYESLKRALFDLVPGSTIQLNKMNHIVWMEDALDRIQAERLRHDGVTLVIADRLLTAFEIMALAPVG